MEVHHKSKDTAGKRRDEWPMAKIGYRVRKMLSIASHRCQITGTLSGSDEIAPRLRILIQGPKVAGESEGGLDVNSSHPDEVHYHGWHLACNREDDNAPISPAVASSGDKSPRCSPERESQILRGET